MYRAKKTEPVQARITENMKIRLEKYCNQRGLTEAQAVRKGLEKILSGVSAK